MCFSSLIIFSVSPRLARKSRLCLDVSLRRSAISRPSVQTWVPCRNGLPQPPKAQSHRCRLFTCPRMTLPTRHRRRPSHTWMRRRCCRARLRSLVFIQQSIRSTPPAEFSIRELLAMSTTTLPVRYKKFCRPISRCKKSSRSWAWTSYRKKIS